MKNLLIFLCLLFAGNIFAQTSAKFNSSTYSFGKIKQGVPVTTTFTFTNTSDKPVVIETATASCGCTTPEYPREAIAKGKTGTIKVMYNAQALGQFTKPITVKFLGEPQPIVLNITGEVVVSTPPK